MTNEVLILLLLSICIVLSTINIYVYQQLTIKHKRNEDFDYQQGFESSPTMAAKDSITKFYRYIVNLLTPKKVVRVSNFTFSDKKNAKICLDLAHYNMQERLAHKSMLS